MKQTITSIIINALESAKAAGELTLPAMPAVTVETPKEAGHGDFATTVALGMAKAERKAPKAIAEIIVKHIANPDGAVEKVEIAGPGFINFFLKPAAWLGVIKDIDEAASHYGHSHVGAGRLVQVEFVSANPTGPLHIGHGRGAAVGDSLCRLLAFTGFDVRREFYINDFGSQVQNLGASIYMRCRQLAGDDGAQVVVPVVADTADDEAGEAKSNLYLGEYITDIAREFMDDPDFLALAEEDKKTYCREEGIKRMLALIADTLARFGVSFDNWYSERSLYDPANDLVKAAMDDLRAKGLVYEDGGALWLRTTEFGDDKDRVMVRANGQTTYFASDIAYHRDKYRRGFSEVIDIWGADHHGYIPRMKAAISALGNDPETFKVLLVQLVNLMREGQPVKMSKRSGDFVTLDEVMEEVGADACRFTFLLRRADSHLDFDLDLVKRQTSENPVYYVQYAHARLCSVFRQAGEKGVALPALSDVNLARLDLPEELNLIKLLSGFPELVEGAALSDEPHRLTYYLQELAGELHAYYFKHRIVTDDLELTYARMYLVKAVRTVIGNALRLLGVSAPEVM
ncbi:MAG: arginine--tRNA ligase [Nitrospirae bacterium]|nr:arginine--tRNA ligase [Nitrospirota bacterium]